MNGIAKINDLGNTETIRTGLLQRAEAFQRGVDTILAAVGMLSSATRGMEAAFPGAQYHPFDIDLEVNGRRYYDRDGMYKPDSLVAHLNRQAWKAAVDETGIFNVMGIEDSKKFREQLESGELPEFTADNVLSVICGLGHQAKDFAKNAAREVFDFLTPKRSSLKTNSAFKIGKRVIIRFAVDHWQGRSFSVNYNRTDAFRSIDSMFHLLDGKGLTKNGRGPLCEAINKGEPTGETEYFKFKCCKNRNLHLEFKRLDLVKELNFVVHGEKVLGK